MKAELIIHNKAIDEHGNTVEIKLWAVEKSSDKPHGYKYSLVYVADARRVIGLLTGDITVMTMRNKRAITGISETGRSRMPSQTLPN
jgi:hypothetical protein